MTNDILYNTICEYVRDNYPEWEYYYYDPLLDIYYVDDENRVCSSICVHNKTDGINIKAYDLSGSNGAYYNIECALECLLPQISEYIQLLDEIRLKKPQFK